MPSLTLQLHDSQIDTTRKALAHYYGVLEKVSKKEMDAGVSATDSLAKMAEVEEIAKTLSPQLDLLTPPPESWESKAKEEEEVDDE